jgi:hypothetical protein
MGNSLMSLTNLMSNATPKNSRIAPTFPNTLPEVKKRTTAATTGFGAGGGGAGVSGGFGGGSGAFGGRTAAAGGRPRAKSGVTSGIGRGRSTGGGAVGAEGAAVLLPNSRTFSRCLSVTFSRSRASRRSPTSPPVPRSSCRPRSQPSAPKSTKRPKSPPKSPQQAATIANTHGMRHVLGNVIGATRQFRDEEIRTIA